MLRSDLSPLPIMRSAGSRKGGFRAGPDVIAPPGRLSAAMPKAQSKEPHLRERQRPRACGKQGKRGLSRPQLPARPTRCRVASAYGAPKTHNAAPSGAYRQMRGTECVHSPAPFIPIASWPGRCLENRRFLLDRNSNLKPSRRDTRKRAGTAAGPCPAECLRIRRAFRHGWYERPASQDAGAARCSPLRRPRGIQARHPR